MPPELASLVAGTINFRVISDHWSELLRLAMCIKSGTVTASVILRKLAAYPRQNGLALALQHDIVGDPESCIKQGVTLSGSGGSGIAVAF